MENKMVGFIPTTLIDYPGEVASVIFFPGCNYKCPYCHNGHLVNNTEENLYPLNLVIKEIERRRKVLGGIVISGGEPTLYPKLEKLVETIKAMGLKVKLDTNGSNPDLLTKLDLDYIAMDLKTSPDKYPGIGGDFNTYLKSFEYLVNGKTEYEIRTTVAPLIFTKEDLIILLPLLKKVKNYYITNFKGGDILVKEYNLNTPYSREYLEELRNICHSNNIPCAIR
jgi:pyruvate formate lyase activating enzyme